MRHLQVQTPPPPNLPIEIRRRSVNQFTSVNESILPTKRPRCQFTVSSRQHHARIRGRITSTRHRAVSITPLLHLLRNIQIQLHHHKSNQRYQRISPKSHTREATMPSIEFKSISGKGVKSLVIFQKPSLYAVVSLSSGDKKNKKKTPVDRTNGENPEWDQPMRVDIDSRDPDLVLQFDLKAEAILGDRLVGKARIPVADLDFSGSIQHASYQLRTPDGKPNGVLNFSYLIEAPGLAAAPPVAVPAPVSSLTPVTNYSPLPSSLAPVGNYSPLSSAPAAGLSPDVSYPALAEPMPVSASGYYPVADPVPVSASGYYPAADPVALYPPPLSGPGYYPSQDSAISYPPPQSGPSYYPSQDSTISYPPPPISADYYRPAPSAAGNYLPPGAQIAAYPPQQECQQVPECCDRSLPQLAPGWGYPPPYAAGYYPPPGTHIAAYPPPQECQQVPECCDRCLPQPAPGWGYPSQPAPRCYPSPAPGVYGPDVYGYT